MTRSGPEATGEGASHGRAPLLHHVLLVSILLMGLVLIAGLGLVIYGFVGTLSTAENVASAEDGTPPAAYERTIRLPEGRRIIDSFAVGDRLVIRLGGDGEDVFLLVEPDSGRLLGRIRVEAEGERP
ncbi:MAG: hypothetical protein D6807_05220 [Alphaproteobacteria bacterium]|nr:MAG: hypothetical protein D6807_05220 [Alphaproteobacteria bacterium]